MGLMDKLSAGIDRAAQEADKAFEKGRTKVGELQTEMQMDGLAKKLGYLVFDFYRGREVDQALRQKYLDDMAKLEDQLLQVKAAAKAKHEAEAAARSAGQDAPGEGGPVASEPSAGAGQTGEAAPPAAE